MPVAATNSETGKKWVWISVYINGSEGAGRVGSSSWVLIQVLVRTNCPHHCSTQLATQLFIQAASMALPHLPQGGAGGTAQLTSVEGRGTHAPEMMCTIAREKWHGTRLVRKWPLGAGTWRMAEGYRDCSGPA